jgi:hypothetical protein
VSPQRAEHFVEPVDRARLGADAATQHQVPMQVRVVQGGRSGELAFRETQVGVQQFGALAAQGLDLGAQRIEVSVCGAADSRASSRVRESVTELPRPDNGSAIQRANSERPAFVTEKTFLSGLPRCSTGSTDTQPSSSMTGSVRYICWCVATQK